MNFNLIENMKQKVANVEQQIKQRSEHHASISQSIEKLSNERIENHSNLHLLTGALQAYQDVLKGLEDICSPVQKVADVISDVAEIVTDVVSDASNENGGEVNG
jgi:methyl-accepting chemotaxis protein